MFSRNIGRQFIFIVYLSKNSLYVFVKLQEIPRAKTQVFYLTTACCLGKLNTIRIWHDGIQGGTRNAWYLSKITVEDLDNQRK